ncbi:MAG: hypothetical protein NE328_10455 [Lentisphaeraceae bacterium]|nr:hypothetical protein [Lentisphaeraceae bacterium]
MRTNIYIFFFVLTLFTSCSESQKAEVELPKKVEVKAPELPSFPVSSNLQKQKTCPFKGTPIKKEFFVDHGDKRIFTCCKECIIKVQNSPQVTETLINARGERVMTKQEAEFAFP